MAKQIEVLGGTRQVFNALNAVDPRPLNGEDPNRKGPYAFVGRVNSTAPRAEQSFSLNGQRLAYTVHGDGPRVTVLLHGLLFSQYMHESLATSLAERGHRVIDTGPYAHVRHPMYSGTVLFFFGMPLLLGSWCGVILAPLFVVLFEIRTGIEERALLAGLPGYADYTTRVRHRLVPGIW